MTRADLPRRAAAEGLGTAFLLVAVVGSGIMAERLAGGNAALALLANAIATGGALAEHLGSDGDVFGTALSDLQNQLEDCLTSPPDDIVDIGWRKRGGRLLKAPAWRLPAR